MLLWTNNWYDRLGFCSYTLTHTCELYSFDSKKNLNYRFCYFEIFFFIFEQICNGKTKIIAKNKWWKHTRTTVQKYLTFEWRLKLNRIIPFIEYRRFLQNQTLLEIIKFLFCMKSERHFSDLIMTIKVMKRIYNPNFS